MTSKALCDIINERLFQEGYVYLMSAAAYFRNNIIVNALIIVISIISVVVVPIKF